MSVPSHVLIALGAAAVLFVAAPAAAQNAPPPTTTVLSEDDVLRHWLRHSREVAAWRTMLGEAHFDHVTATLWPNPTISVNAMGTVSGTPPDAPFNVGGQITQPLPILGQLGARDTAGRALESVAEVNVRATLWSRAGDIMDALVDRAFADASAQLAQRNVDEMTRLQGIVQQRVAAGANGQYDAVRVATSMATLRAALSNALVERQRAEAQILALVADPELTSAPITREGLAAFRGPEDEQRLLRMALQRRPDLMLAQRSITAYQAAAAHWRAEIVPVPSIWAGVYGGSALGYQPPMPGHDSFSIVGGLAFNLPITDQNQGLIGHAEVDVEQQQALSDALRARIRTEVTAAWRARAEARRALDDFRSGGLAAATEVLSRAEVSYQAGGGGAAQFTIADLLDAYRTAWEARAQELALERTAAEAEVDLEHATALVPP